MTTPGPEAPSHRRVAREPRRRLASALALVAVVALVTLALVRIGTSGGPLSVVDEPAHLDTALRVHDGSYPHRGSLYSDDLIEIWGCGVGHESSGMVVPCDPTVTAASLPSGQYTTGYIHYPTYFAAGEVFRWLVAPDGGTHGPIDAYRAWSAVLGGLGLLGCLLAGAVVGLRGARLWAATLVPAAGSGIVFLNTIVNPGSAALLCGGLIAGAGVRWVLTGRGFWWLAAAAGVAASLAVTHALATGAFMLAILVVRTAPWLRLAVPRLAWSPRWWQLGVLSAIVLVPVVVWNRVIEAQATVSNGTVYGGVPDASGLTIVRGAVEELFTVLTPWIEGQVLLAGPDAAGPVQILRATSYGIPLLVSVLVLGLLATAVLGLVPPPGSAGDQREDPTGPASTWTLRLLAACTLATLFLYPVALRVSNSFTFGFDYPIVNRYSIGLAPLLVLLVLLLVPGRAAGRVLAVLATLCVAGICVTAL